MNRVIQATNGNSNGQARLERAATQPVTYTSNGRKKQIDLDSLVDDADTDGSYAEKLSGQLSDDGKEIVVDLRQLHEADNDRRAALFNILGANDAIQYRIGGDGAGQIVNSLHDATVANLVAMDDPQRCERAIEAAADAISRMPQDAQAVAAARCMARLKALKVSHGLYKFFAKIVSRITAEKKKAQAAERPEKLTSVRSVLPSAPVDESLVVPSDWLLSARGIRQIGDDPEDPPIISAPVLISERSEGLASDDQTLTIVFSQDGKWRTLRLPRRQAANARLLVDAAQYGLPVTSNNSRVLVQYLAEYEAANIQQLPVTRTASQLGWQGEDGEHGFMFGDTFMPAISPEYELAEKDAVNEGEKDHRPNSVNVSFAGRDVGDTQLAESVRLKGTYPEWRRGIAAVQGFPRMQLVGYASLCPPLLAIVGGTNFIFDLCGGTSIGKTTALRYGASFYGCPDERAPHSIVRTFNSTRIGTERILGTMSDLPIFLDESKLARSSEDLKKLVYDVQAGRDCNRATTIGTAASVSYRTVMISTGESPLASIGTDAAGSKLRVVTSWGSPFGTTDAETGKIVTSLNAAIRENYGHAGRRFVQHLVAHRHRWPGWKHEFEEHRKRYVGMAGDNNFAIRMADYFAIMDVAAGIAHGIKLLPWEFQDPIGKLYPVLIQEVDQADRAAVALEFVISWAGANEHEFQGREYKKYRYEPDAAHPPAKGWAGIWVRDNDKIPGEVWKCLFFFPHRLEELLKGAGFDVQATLRTWRDRKWLVADKPSGGTTRLQYTLSHRGQPTRVYAIRRSAIEVHQEKEPPQDDKKTISSNKQEKKKAAKRHAKQVRRKSEKAV